MKAIMKNLLFEFSATIPQEFNVLEKYQDKIIYEYTLRVLQRGIF